MKLVSYLKEIGLLLENISKTFFKNELIENEVRAKIAHTVPDIRIISKKKKDIMNDNGKENKDKAGYKKRRPK